MNIITFDGHLGAGKSTQIELLVKHYSGVNIEQAGDRFWRIQYIVEQLFNFADSPITSDTLRLLWYAMLYRMMVSYGEKHKLDLLILEESFFLSLLNMNPSRLDDEIRFFRDMLTFQSGIEPVASFFIDIPANECGRRRFYRGDIVDRNEAISINLDTSIISDEDRHTTERWVALSEQIPYLHIIDGTQSIDAVSKEIISIVDGEFYENSNI